MINIVDNQVQVENALNLAETKADQDTKINIDAFTSSEDQEEEAEEANIFVVEEMLKFKGGGVKSFRNYIQKNIEYPTIAAENGIEGTVYVQFVVDKDGGISNTKIMSGVDPSLNKEVKRVIRNAPKWESGKQRNKPVKVQFTIPIVFKLQ